MTATTAHGREHQPGYDPDMVRVTVGDDGEPRYSITEKGLAELRRLETKLGITDADKQAMRAARQSA